MFVYWAYDEVWSGAKVELPLPDTSRGIVNVDYFAQDAMWRASSGRIQLLKTGQAGHYAVALDDVRFDELDGLALNGIIGAKLEHYACVGCN